MQISLFNAMDFNTKYSHIATLPSMAAPSAMEEVIDMDELHSSKEVDSL